MALITLNDVMEWYRASRTLAVSTGREVFEYADRLKAVYTGIHLL